MRIRFFVVLMPCLYILDILPCDAMLAQHMPWACVRPSVCLLQADIVLHTHPFNGPLSRTIQVSPCQKGKTNLDFTGARDSEWQWHQLDHNASVHLAPDR